MAAAHQFILLHSVGQELGPAQGQPRPGQQLRDVSLPLLPVMPHPRQHCLKHLKHRGGGTIATVRVRPAHELAGFKATWPLYPGNYTGCLGLHYEQTASLKKLRQNIAAGERASRVHTLL